MRKTHKQKVREAKAMITHAERKAGVAIFSSRQWLQRKHANLRRQLKQYWEAQERRAQSGVVKQSNVEPAKVVAIKQTAWQRLRAWLSGMLSKLWHQ